MEQPALDWLIRTVSCGEVEARRCLDALVQAPTTPPGWTPSVPEGEARALGASVTRALDMGRDLEQVLAILTSVRSALGCEVGEALGREAELFLELARRRLAGTDPARREGGAGRDLPGQPRQLIHLRCTDSPAQLVLGDPPRNEMNTRFFGQLAGLVDHLRRGPALGGLVVRGEGRHFSSGADLAELGQRVSCEEPSSVRLFIDENMNTFQALTCMPFPVVAAVRGCCLGSGFELALACHHRVAATNAVFALPEAQYGLMPGCGGTVRLTRLLGPVRALELILSGRTILAQEALELGLVDRVVPGAELLDAARQAAR